MSNKKHYIVLSIIAIVLGGTTYILFRENSYISNFIESFFELQTLRSFFAPFDCIFIKYYFVDFIWAFSLISILNFLSSTKKETILISMFVFILGAIWEILQWLHIISGTGDLIDVFMYLIAGVSAVIIKYANKKGEQK